MPIMSKKFSLNGGKNSELLKQVVAGVFALAIFGFAVYFSFGLDFSGFALEYGYLGVFLISVVGTATILFPAPYTIALFFMGSLQSFDPFLLSLVAGFGAAVGESASYLVGFAGRRLVPEKHREKIEPYRRIFERHGFAAIFVFSATPLPDDLLYIPVGMMKYPFAKFFLAAFAGKTLMSAVIIYSGFYSLSLVNGFFEGFSLLTLPALAGIAAAVFLIAFAFKKFFSHVREK
ncbi:MAG: VTT domain-containing protein [Candidatus Diapherotrites archaeon]|nr:VTT domain-containing protein [Candidatus Diapherotrites archaeon]